MHKDMKKVLISADELQQKHKELGERLAKDYQGRNPLCIGILKGAVPFLTHLVQNMDIPLEIDFMSVSSYGSSAQSSGVVRILKDLDVSIEGRHVLIVEDVIDSGLTLRYLVDLLERRNPASVKTVVLLDKTDCRTIEMEADYVGFQIPDDFVVGFGLDYAEKYRNLPYVGVLKEEIYR